MDPERQQVPELTVETENVRRRNSSSTSIQSLSDNSVESVKKLEPPTEVDSVVKDEVAIGKVDSDSKFGLMETVSLDLSFQESTTSGMILNDENKVLQENAQLGTDTTLLNKYFGSDPLKQGAEDVDFFNTLAKSPEVVELLAQDTSQQGNKSGEVKSALTEGESVNKTDSTAEPPPALLKFFSEDKSGKDVTGKAFFDKIAEDKKAPIILQVNEPILGQALQDKFLSAPSFCGEIEEAWISSEKTRQMLVSYVTSSTPVTLHKSQCTLPSVIIDQDMVDPVKQLLIECNSPEAQRRKTLTENDVTEDEDGLQKLMEARCYHAALNLTKRLLKTFGQGVGDDGKHSNHTPLSLRIWYIRLALFIRLQKYSFAEIEGSVFGDLDEPDLYYEYYPETYKGKRGTMVPFPLRLLLAELPQYQGNHQTALDNMYRILNVIQKMIYNIQNGCAEDGTMIDLSESRRAASLEIWGKREKRVLYSILNCVLSQKDYIVAVSVTKKIIEKSTEDLPQLHSALGRIYLQIGDVKNAQDCFTQAVALSIDTKQKFEAEENINKGLLAIAHNNYEDAYKLYEQAYSLCPNNAMLANNIAVCLLYMGQLKKSLALLEKTINTKPLYCLHDGLLFNICTLYELESSQCSQKKIAMLELVSKYAGDAFNVSCLKIQTAKA